MPTRIPEHLPVAPSCIRNQEPIAELLTRLFSDVNKVLEIGSGTGQHAMYCASKLPHLKWQPTDLEECIEGIERWREYTALPNVLPARVLDVTNKPWMDDGNYDGVFSANVLHFVGWNIVDALLAGLSEVTGPGAVALFYGPFNVNGQYTSEGNEALDEWLKQRDPDSGIKDINEISEKARNSGWILKDRHTMPANNLVLEYWRADQAGRSLESMTE